MEGQTEIFSSDIKALENQIATKIEGKQNKNSIQEIKEYKTDINGYITWYYGDWIDGFFRNGTWVDGVWHDGTWCNGDWLGGDWINGTWYKGTIDGSPSNTNP